MALPTPSHDQDTLASEYQYMPQYMPASDNTHYKVYLVAYEGLQEFDHHAIYVDSEPNLQLGPTGKSSGHVFHVQGSILEGMDFEVKKVVRHDLLFLTLGKSMLPVGWVLHENFVERIEKVCQNIPPPHSQLTLRSRPIYPNIPIRHCQHWAADAMHALCVAEVLEPLGPSDDQTVVLCPTS
jgi:hypothetical protein